MLEVDREALDEATAQRRKHWITDMESVLEMNLCACAVVGFQLAVALLV